MKQMTSDLARKILPLARQYEIQEGWLKKRLATLLPQFMNTGSAAGRIIAGHNMMIMLAV